MHFADVVSLRQTAREAQIDYSGSGISEEYRRSGVLACVCMGIVESGQRLGRYKLLASSLRDSANPMLPNLEPKNPDCLHWCAGINPIRLKKSPRLELAQIEQHLQLARTVGLKIYPGYYPVYVYDAVYEPIYELAAAYHLPVVFHTGETYSVDANQNYAHPEAVLQVARAHPKVVFVVAHLGVPWIEEASRAAQQQDNIILELSGLVEGGARGILRARGDGEYRQEIEQGLCHLGDYCRVVFGTDWPLVPIAEYCSFMAELVPEKHHQQVFFDNALRIFFGNDRDRLSPPSESSALTSSAPQ